MRWSIIGIIFYRELRDQLRDRRTIFMIVVLPLLLYPFLGMGVIQFALTLSDQPSVVGIVGSEHLPPYQPLTNTAWLALAPDGPGLSLGLDRVLGAAALGYVEFRQPRFPPLLIGKQVNDIYFDSAPERRNLQVQLLDQDDPTLLETKQVDLMILAPADFMARLRADGRPVLELRYRENDERSRTAAARVYSILRNWKRHLREIRLVHKGLPADFDDPVQIRDPERDKSSDRGMAEGLLDLLVRIFPFLLVMWSLAGALYPAVDICAGEKERGTMETLLISPASREEIVWGKFLTIWLFSAASALLNLASMGITSSLFGGVLPHGTLPALAFVWCVVVTLPLTAFFSAICLAVGAYARSTKEGQYYLIPLFFLTMPLVFLTLAPGVELNAFYSMVPVTGVALLMQRLMTSTLEKVPWLYFVPVLTPMALYGWLALRWAIEQFRREEVLFREAERVELKLWLGRLFREKEAFPSGGQAAFCFFLIMLFRRLFFSGGQQDSLVVQASISYLAFVAAPTLFMAIMLTRRPLESLSFKWPPSRALLVASVLAVLLLPPLEKLNDALLEHIPTRAAPGEFLLVFGLLASACEEIAFRGFILSGLRRRLPPWTAIVISSLLFAVYQLNVFQAVPAFVLGLVLALLTVWSASVIPAMLLHLLHNCLIYSQGKWVIEGIVYFPGSHLSPIFSVIFGIVALGVLIVIARELSGKSARPASESA